MAQLRISEPGTAPSSVAEPNVVEPNVAGPSVVEPHSADPRAAQPNAAQAREVVVVCEQCPFGCVVSVSLDQDGQVAHVEGNTCERGWEFAHEAALNGAPKGASKNKSEAPEEAEPPSKPARGYRAFRREHARKRQEEKSQVN